MAHFQARAGSGLLAGAFAGVLALTSCAAPGPESESEGSAATLTRAELDLLTQSGSYAEDENVLSHAESQLTAECMSENGFRYHAGEFVSVSGSYVDRELNMTERRSKGYGLYDQFSAQAEGGTAGSVLSEPSSTDYGAMANDKYIARLPEAKAESYMRALRGRETDLREVRLPDDGAVTFSGKGCEAESRRQLFGKLDYWAAATYVPQNLNNSLTDRVTEAPAYSAAMRGWKECMSEKGYAYTYPDDAHEQLKAEYGKRGATRGMRQREIDVAVADGTCAQELRIPSTVLSLRKQHARSLPADDKRDLRALTKVWAAAVARAQQLIK